MPRPADVPPALLVAPFTVRDADAAGLPRDALRRRCFRRLFRGVYAHETLEQTPTTMLRALLMVLPAGSVVSHRSAARVLGFRGARWPTGEWEVSVRGTTVTKHAGVRLHRRMGELDPRFVDGLPVTGPERTVVDCALRSSVAELVQLAEAFVASGLTTVDRLVSHVVDSRLPGVVRAREAARLVREGAESPMESLVRVLVVAAGLPEPRINVAVVDGSGRFVARVDLLLERWKVIVEYDGRHHETDPGQWRRDRLRREALEALGYRVVVVAAADLARPASVPWRVHAALRSRGYTGPPPSTGSTWARLVHAV